MDGITDAIMFAFATKALQDAGKWDVVPDQIAIDMLKKRFTYRFENGGFVLVPKVVAG